jgi:RNA-splicing ligase RtcB
MLHQNYTERESHGGREMWITRKGAIKADAVSYNSSSHGAGRRMSRGQAKRQLDKAGLRERMKGKAWNAGSATDLIDEVPRAYKDIKQVMADQSDLTEVVHVLTQVLNYKGTS